LFHGDHVGSALSRKKIEASNAGERRLTTPELQENATDESTDGCGGARENELHAPTGGSVDQPLEVIVARR
jgi:hypothetical protein